MESCNCEDGMDGTVEPIHFSMNLIRFVIFSVRHTIEEMDFRWKEEEPITIFNEELAEFDVVKVDVESKNVSYVSG